MRPYTRADDAAGHGRSFCGRGCGPLGVGPKMTLDVSRLRLTRWLRKCITSRARTPFCKKRVPPHFPLFPSSLSSALYTIFSSRLLAIPANDPWRRDS